MPSTFTIVTETPFPVEALFDVSLDIDAHVESMAASSEQAVAGVTTGRIGLGETVTWRARHFGIWFTMTSKITALDRPARFVDQQVRGPFALFVHEHVFEPHEAGSHGAGSRMTDRITVGSPVFGRLAERLILVPYLRRLIAARNAHLIERLS
jgi:ligand-binding SRPBCC domain-containing protein